MQHQMQGQHAMQRTGSQMQRSALRVPINSRRIVRVRASVAGERAHFDTLVTYPVSAGAACIL